MKLFKDIKKIKNLFFQKKCIIICCIIFFSTLNSFAQTYIQTRVGYVHQPYKALHPEILNRDEHDYLGGYMLDVEIGKQLKSKKVTFLFGVRIQQIKEDVKGIYTQYQIIPDADIDVYRTSFLLTGGLSIPLIEKISLQVQFSGGPKYTLWYQDRELKDSWWSWNLPFDSSLKYSLSNKLKLVGGISTTMPIYTSRTTIFYCGIITKL